MGEKKYGLRKLLSIMLLTSSVDVLAWSLFFDSGTIGDAEETARAVGWYLVEERFSANQVDVLCRNLGGASSAINMRRSKNFLNYMKEAGSRLNLPLTEGFNFTYVEDDIKDSMDLAYILRDEVDHDELRDVVTEACYRGATQRFNKNK